MQCGHSEIPYPAWAQGWIDVRKMFSNWFGMRRCGIVKMLDCIGLQFEGNQHCGNQFLDPSTIHKVEVLGEFHYRAG